MYKVFIDNKLIVFIHTNDLSTVNLQLKSKEVERVKDLKGLLEVSGINNPLYLTSKKPFEEFNRLFKDYKYIEAAGGIVQRKKSFLVIKRKGLWDIPKGKIEKEELPEVACIREIAEECGIDGHQITRPLVNTYHVMNWKGQKALKKTFWFMLRYNGSKEVTPALEEEITDVVWMKEDELLGIRSNTFGSINEVLDAFMDC